MNAFLALGEGRSDPQQPRSAHVHPLDSVKQPGKQKNAIDANVRNEDRAVLFESSVLIEETPRPVPADWVSMMQPQPKFDSVERMLPNRRAFAGMFADQFQSLLQGHR